MSNMENVIIIRDAQRDLWFVAENARGQWTMVDSFPDYRDAFACVEMCKRHPLVRS